MLLNTDIDEIVWALKDKNDITGNTGEILMICSWFGQNVCAPISPRYSECLISRHCRRVAVARSR